jgi:hypothetical protein
VEPTHETGAPFGVIENRFPALFETRRMLYPRLAKVADVDRYDQGIGGFMDNILRRNFVAFVEQSGVVTGNSVAEVERSAANSPRASTHFSSSASTRGARGKAPAQKSWPPCAASSQLRAISWLLRRIMMWVMPRRPSSAITVTERGFARSILAGLGVPVENRFGLHPASDADGSPSPIVAERQLDRLGLLEVVATFNLHPHLPHLERLGDAFAKLDVLARQAIDQSAPAHPRTADGRWTFGALLQSRPDIFAGDLVVGDATLWSSTAGGVESLKRLWTNLLKRRV